MTAAFELSRPEHDGRFEITVYQEGWRLGGKGASGRGPSGRVEEHGLHVWLGFYENAFRLMRECYAELESNGQRSIFGHWREAFLPEGEIGLFHAKGGDGWRKWTARFPPLPGLPGDPQTPGDLLSLSTYLERTIAMLRTLILDSGVSRHGPDGPAPSDRPSLWPPEPGLLDDPQRLLRAIQAVLGRSAFTGALALAEALGVLQTALKALPTTFDSAITRLAEVVASGLRGWLEDHFLADDPQTNVWEVIDLVLAIVVGSFRFGLLTDPRGLDAIDDYECREWLRLNGASERALQSPFMRGLYDLALGYEQGDPARPGLAAGQALRGALRMFFGYRGSVFWRMRAGMGDVVFAPLYEVLRQRGVRFEFFHRLTNVGLPPGGAITPGNRSYVASLDFDVQARIAEAHGYAPLVEIAGKPCWPARPDFAQLVEGERFDAEGWDFESHWDRRHVATKRLEVGRDFDFAVLGVSIGAVPYVCAELVARDERWRRMAAEVKTVATQAFQIWLQEDLPALGWEGAPYIVTAFTKPFDTWCDMAHVVPEENWRARPKTSIYFCGVLADPESAPGEDDLTYPKRRADEVRASALSYLRETARPLWPGAYDPQGEFRWELLADGVTPAGAAEPAGPARFATQYWRANVNPSDRYVLALPGSLKYRISPLDMTYDNLTIAGDWTDCGFNEGCVEAAVMSGRLAAHALSGLPALAEITGYDHP